MREPSSLALPTTGPITQTWYGLRSGGCPPQRGPLLVGGAARAARTASLRPPTPPPPARWSVLARWCRGGRRPFACELPAAAAFCSPDRATIGECGKGHGGPWALVLSCEMQRRRLQPSVSPAAPRSAPARRPQDAIPDVAMRSSAFSASGAGRQWELAMELLRQTR